MRCIPLVVASLAERAAPVGIRMCLVVIHVCDRQHDIAPCLGVGLAVGRTAVGVLGGAFASVASPEEQKRAEGFPDFGVDRPAWVTLHSLWADRHIRLLSLSRLYSGGRYTLSVALLVPDDPEFAPAFLGQLRPEVPAVLQQPLGQIIGC